MEITKDHSTELKIAFVGISYEKKEYWEVILASLNSDRDFYHNEYFTLEGI